jgi:hypothetical protein
MIRKIGLTAAAIVALGLAGGANAADKRVRPAAVAAPPAVVVVQDCAAFYDDYAVRGFGWGHGPGTSLGFGVFEGALPRYPFNEFPNWYGECVRWGNYHATGTAIGASGVAW